MKLLTLFGAGLVALCMSAAAAAPAIAAADPYRPVVIEMLAPAPAVDCLASFDTDAVILFVESDRGCDVTMAELTGLCLSPATTALPVAIAAVLDPDLGISCTSLRPSPPG